MSILELARRMFRRSVALKTNRAILAVNQLEDRTVPSNLNLSASASPANVQLGSEVSVAGSVMASDPMSSISVDFGWGDGLTDSDSYS